MDDALAEHLRMTAANGLSREEVKKLLLAAGWPVSQVSGYLEKAFKNLDKGTIIRVQGVAKSFGTKQVLTQVDVDIQSGELFGLIGMSGTGKTTLLNILVGFVKPDSGDVQVALPDGTTQSVLRNPDIVKSRVGFSTQTPSFYPRLTVRENLEHFARLYGFEDPDLSRKANALLDLVGLTAAKDVVSSHLSGGMQKRLDIACALIHDPAILILDEPTADLDPVLRKQLWELIRQINAKGTTILLASHFLAEIELLCTRIAILQNGRVIEKGTADELRNLYSTQYELYLQLSSQNYKPILGELQRARKYWSKAGVENDELVVQTAYPEGMLSFLAAHVHKGELQSLHLTRPTLGRVFESLVKRQ